MRRANISPQMDFLSHAARFETFLTAARDENGSTRRGHNFPGTFVCSLLMGSALLWPAEVRCQTPTSITAVHGLSPEAAARKVPVVVAGTVTGIGFWPYGITVQDGDDGIFVALAAGASPVSVGQRVLVRGTTDQGGFAPIINAAQIEVKGFVDLPRAYFARAKELAWGELDNRLVEVRGVVRATAPGRMGDGTSVFMVVDMNPGIVHVALARGIHLDATQFVDATIRAKGIVGVEFNKRRQALGASVVVNRVEDISIVRTPAAAASSGTPTPMADIFRWGPHPDWSHRIKVAGILTLQRPGEFLILQDGDQAIRVETLDTTKLPLGTRFEVSGFAVPAEFGPVLRDAVVGVRGTAEPVKALVRQASQLYSPPSLVGPAPAGLDDNWLLIKLRARLVETHEYGSGVTLLLDDGGIQFSATAPASAARELEKLTLGSRLELTGIYEVLVDPLHIPQGFRLLIRSSGDVTVLSSGPWLNATHFRWSALVFGATALLSALWALTLRSRVRGQTAWISWRLRREQGVASLHAERSKVLELIGRNEPLTVVCEGLMSLILVHNPFCEPAIGIRSGEEWHWTGCTKERTSGFPIESIEVVSASGAWGAKVVLIAAGPAPAESEFLQTCRECMSIALDHRELHERLLLQTLSDPLTHLPNRRSLDSHLEQVIETSRRNMACFAILAIDLDGFKTINDTLGHAAGDIVLQELASRFQLAMRKDEMISRIGGDEFVAVLEQVIGYGDAQQVASRLAAAAVLPIDISGVQIHPSLSIGIAVYPVDGETPKALRSKADIRMYELKVARGHRKGLEGSIRREMRPTDDSDFKSAPCVPLLSDETRRKQSRPGPPAPAPHVETLSANRLTETSGLRVSDLGEIQAGGRLK